MGLTKQEQKIIEFMDKFVDFTIENKRKDIKGTVFLRNKEYLLFLEMVKKKERRDPHYECLNIYEGLYRGFKVEKSGL